MSFDENRRPIYAKAIPSIRWKKYGAHMHLDPGIESLLEYSVYRYTSIAEALCLCDGRMTFANPKKWPDKYESHLTDRLFSGSGPFAHAIPFVKCFSVEYSSEAMWRTYSSPGGVVRMGIKLQDLIDSLDEARWPSDAKIYVGRVRYMDPPKLRQEIKTLEDNPPKAVMNNAMPALLMKRSGFAFENEVRIGFLPRAAKNIPPVITASNFRSTKISRMLLDPYLPQWQTDELKRLFVKKLGVPFKVHRSSFDAHPIDLG
jgi:Protein of unknown function (DUF2971)